MCTVGAVDPGSGASDNAAILMRRAVFIGSLIARVVVAAGSAGAAVGAEAVFSDPKWIFDPEGNNFTRGAYACGLTGEGCADGGSIAEQATYWCKTPRIDSGLLPDGSPRPLWVRNAGPAVSFDRFDPARTLVRPAGADELWRGHNLVNLDKSGKGSQFGPAMVFSQIVCLSDEVTAVRGSISINADKDTVGRETSRNFANVLGGGYVPVHARLLGTFKVEAKLRQAGDARPWEAEISGLRTNGAKFSGAGLFRVTLKRKKDRLTADETLAIRFRVERRGRRGRGASLAHFALRKKRSLLLDSRFDGWAVVQIRVTGGNAFGRSCRGQYGRLQVFDTLSSDGAPAPIGRLPRRGDRRRDIDRVIIAVCGIRAQTWTAERNLRGRSRVKFFATGLRR